MTHDIMDHVRVTHELWESEQTFATVTLLEIRGSAPQVAGAKMVLDRDGLQGGTIGGGKIEAAAIDHAQQMMSHQSKSTELVTWNLQTDIGMTCGGEVKLFFEIHRKTSWPIAVFGAGHLAQALIPILTQLNCRISCLDPRSDWLAKLENHPKLRKCEIEKPEHAVKDMDANTFFVLVSKGHATDLPVLKEVLKKKDVPYVGVVGSLQKAKALRKELASSGLAEAKLDSFFCPIGLPMGNNTPVEIAISIVGQLIQVRDQLGVLDHRPKSFG